MNRIALACLAFAAALIGACDNNDDPAPVGPPNGDFAANTSGWAVEDAADVTLAWSSLNANGGAGSGSALVTNTSIGASNGSGITQCVVAITGGATYTFGGKVLYPTGQARTGELALGLRWYSGPGCTGSMLGEQPRVRQTTPGATWVSLSDQVVAPQGAGSADFIAYPSKVEAGGQLSGNFDDLFIRLVNGPYLLVAPSGSHP